jgi:hypothetical protein
MRIMDIEKSIKKVEEECLCLQEKYTPPYHSYHEAYAVIREELDEFWDCVKQNNELGMKEELIQIAATAIMAIQFWEQKNENI